MLSTLSYYLVPCTVFNELCQWWRIFWSAYPASCKVFYFWSWCIQRTPPPHSHKCSASLQSCITMSDSDGGDNIVQCKRIKKVSPAMSPVIITWVFLTRWPLFSLFLANSALRQSKFLSFIDGYLILIVFSDGTGDEQDFIVIDQPSASSPTKRV